MELSRGRSVEFEYDFVDENLNDLGWWAHKHVDYSSREAADIEDILSSSAAASGIDGQAGRKRAMKGRYTRHFMQGWWYRTLVDARQFEKQKKGSANTVR